MNFGTTGVDAPKAASSSVARYSCAARLAASGGSPAAPSTLFCLLASALIQAAIDNKALAANETFFNAPREHGLEQPAQEIAVAEAAMAVL